MDESTVYIAIGSNLGERAGNCEKAAKLLCEFGEIKAASPLYDTEPWGVIDQPRFINGALELSTLLKPLELIAALKSIEGRMGRKHCAQRRYGARVIDLDIIFFDDRVIDCGGPGEEGTLVIPHPGCRRGPLSLCLSQRSPPELSIPS